MPKKDLRKELEKILNDRRSEIMVYDRWVINAILALFESVIPKDIKPPKDLQETLSILQGVQNAYSIAGEIKGYNQALKDIRQKIGESK